MATSEAFRTKERVDQVPEQQRGDGPGQQVVHDVRYRRSQATTNHQQPRNAATATAR
jgi:hypothetical protein